MRNTLILILIFLSVHCNSQNVNYRITSKETSIGNLSVKKIEENNTIQIEVVSEVTVRLFITIDFKYKLNCTYKDKELIFSSVITYVNGRVHSTTTTKKDGEYYSITKNNHSSKYLNEINFPAALLYFVEPEGVTKIFSEFDGIAKPIKEIVKNKYQITNPKNGRLSEYLYRNGILESSINHHSLMTFTLTKI
ncbi:MAG: hypothetical protein GXO84_02095 [Chlorobi bacterium]|nr:hypothetical protein [Chlorobiota bacterium]